MSADSDWTPETKGRACKSFVDDLLGEIVSVQRGKKRVWEKIDSNQRSKSIQFSSEDEVRGAELNWFWSAVGINFLSRRVFIPRWTETIYFKHYEQIQTKRLFTVGSASVWPHNICTRLQMIQKSVSCESIKMSAVFLLYFRSANFGSDKTTAIVMN